MVRGIPAIYTVKCKSNKGELLMINELEFNRKVKTNEETLKSIEDTCY